MSKNVFVLGSGFSRDIAGYPTLSELSEFIANHMEIPGSLRQMVAPLRRRLIEPDLEGLFQKYVPKPLKKNIEHLMTYLYGHYPWRSSLENNIHQVLYEVVTEALVDVFIDRQNNLAGSTPKQESLRKLMLSWHKRDSTVITFNYDILIEHELSMGFLKRKHLSSKDSNLHYFTAVTFFVADELSEIQKEITEVSIGFKKLGNTFEVFITVPNRECATGKIVAALKEKFHPLEDEMTKFMQDVAVINSLYGRLKDPVLLDNIYQFPIRDIRSRTHTLFSPSNMDSFKYLKLHGSINWFYSGNETGSNDSTYFIQSDQMRGNSQKEYKKSRLGLVPLIIPPILDKSSFYGATGIKLQWELAREALAAAEHIYVIGYSLPETDISTQFLFQEALNLNSTKLTLILQDSEERFEEIKNRYSKLFDGADDRFIAHNIENGSSVEFAVNELGPC